MPDQLDKFRVTAFFDMPGSVQAQNVWHVHQEGIAVTTDEDVLDATLVSLRDNWWRNFQDNVSNVVIFDRFTMDEVNALGEIIRFVGTRVIGETGNGPDDMLPHMDSGLISADTFKTRVRGRKFLPGTSEGNQDDGLLSTAAVSRNATALAGILVGYLVPPSTLWLYGVISTVVGDFVTFANTGKATNLIATQRRRRIGRGS